MACILVIGASRGTGLETVRKALAAGHHVRALARSAASIPIVDERLEKITGDATDRTALLNALEGIDAVIVTLGVSPSLSTSLSGTRLFSTATRALVDTMKEKGVRRLVAITGIGAGESRGHGGPLYDWVIFPLMLKRVYDDKDMQEQIIRRSGLDWTIVRPGLLTNGPETGRYRALLDPAQWRADSISRADVADFLAKEVTERKYVGQAPVLVG
ncbi:MAG TPA: SDR family oxidoreductase [Hyphomicrobiaceae bacterium]|jgi:putative NADH-flavin reductase